MTKNNRVGAVPPNKSAFIGNDNISLRDYFAGLAMQAMMSVADIDDLGAKYLAEIISKDSYEMADKMLEAKDAST